MESLTNVGRANDYPARPVPQIQVDGPSSDTSNVASHRRVGVHKKQQPPSSPPPRLQPSPSQVADTEEQRLNDLLRKQLPCYVGTETPIAQPHVLRDILTYENVLALLKEYQASGDIPEDEDVGYTIWDVLQDEVFDDHLPLAYDEAAKPTLFLWDSYKRDWRRLRCFMKARTWGTQAKLDICQWQWYLTVPHMKVDVNGPSFKAYEAKFEKRAKMPWSSKSRDGKHLKDESTRGWGGYSAVYRYHIDDRFHGFHKVLAKIGLSGGNGFFALKVLNLYSENDKAALQGLSNMFRNERQQLNSFNGSVHEHLVTLLAAFEQKDVNKNYFLFPWAECDLSGYWEDPGKARNAKWVSEQLSGLVGALDKIHNPSHLQGRYGRHGDLKPDNILWYAPYKGDSKGILVISDMGFTAVNSELSRSKQTNGKARTPTYRAPELDVHGANVSREYDVWCLGCIFLEMMMWLLGGDEMIKKFKSERMTPENGTNTPIFFTFNNQRQAVVKPEVIQKWNCLVEHPPADWSAECCMFVNALDSDTMQGLGMLGMTFVKTHPQQQPSSELLIVLKTCSSFQFRNLVLEATGLACSLCFRLKYIPTKSYALPVSELVEWCIPIGRASTNCMLETDAGWSVERHTSTPVAPQPNKAFKKNLRFSSSAYVARM
ncbi:kinase-like domain-containing protein [Pestalotiopsis sp. NC0098]|nr:kinase-like domain-containing protein [Pestalotiopsis sp. NC0098]